MAINQRVRYIGEDRHMLRNPLTGCVGTVRLVSKSTAFGVNEKDLFVEFDRDAPHVSLRASNGWWISPRHLQPV